MEERLRFVARNLDGEGMSDVCRSFGTSRKTGDKIFNRDKEAGVDAVCDRPRRLVRYTNQLPDQVQRLIVACKRQKPHWSARKSRERLVREPHHSRAIPRTTCQDSDRRWMTNQWQVTLETQP